MVKTPHWAHVIHEFLRPGHSRLSRVNIPPLDGPLRPNSALEELSPLAGGEMAEPTDVLPQADGSVLVSSGCRVLRLGAGGDAGVSVVAELGGPVTTLAGEPSGALLAGVGGVGVVRIEPSDRAEPVVIQAGGRPLACPTAVAVHPASGVIYVTDGSRTSTPERWVWDLMEGNASGRLVAVDPKTGAATVLLEGLAWPAGVAVSPDGRHLVFSTAWDHSVRRYDLDGTGTVAVLQQGLPGYPGTLTPTPGDGYWLSVFALRTQLVELLLMEDEYRTEMMRTIDPDYWIRPALRSLDSPREPLQGGAIRKLGVKKPWAPPRSYGMVLRLDGDGEIVASLQSPADGTRHGIASARQRGGTVFIAAQGADAILIHQEAAA